jgi:hypothetical protein
MNFFKVIAVLYVAFSVVVCIIVGMATYIWG